MRQTGCYILAPLPRHREPERMDEPGIDARLHHQALRGLSRLNALSATARSLAEPIQRLARARRLQRVRVLDIACGAGDIARRLENHLSRVGIAAEVAGCDLSHTAVAHATARSGRTRFFQLDALGDRLPTDYDVLTCSLFLHHLDESQAIHLLRRMGEAARHLVIVSDLHRSRINLALTYAATRVLSRSSVVHFDGPVSVHAAYTSAEAAVMAHMAGLNGARVRRHWACRYMLEWERNDGVA